MFPAVLSETKGTTAKAVAAYLSFPFSSLIFFDGHLPLKGFFAI